MARPLFGVRVLNYGRDASRKGILDGVSACEDEGYHSVWVAERLLVPYPPNQPWSKESPLCFEPLILLSYIAGVTERVKLGTFVLITPLRNPLVLAKQVTTLDVMSRGRVILGLGLGWMKEEFAGSSVSLEERGARTDETIRFLREMWGTVRPAFNGKFTKLGPTLFEPKPVQEQIPIWIGGESAPALRRVGRLGDGWLPNTIVKPSEIEECVTRIAEEAESNGRSIENITISCKLRFKGTSHERTAAVRTIEKLQRVGVSHFVVDFEHESASDYAQKIKLFSRETMRSF